MPFPLIAAVIGGAASLGGAAISARASRKASDAQQASQRKNIQLSEQHTAEGLADFDSALNSALAAIRGEPLPTSGGGGGGLPPPTGDLGGLPSDNVAEPIEPNEDEMSGAGSLSSFGRRSSFGGRRDAVRSAGQAAGAAGGSFRDRIRARRDARRGFTPTATPTAPPPGGPGAASLGTPPGAPVAPTVKHGVPLTAPGAPPPAAGGAAPATEPPAPVETPQALTGAVGAAEYQQPYYDTGANALDAYADSLGLNGTEGNAAAVERFQTSPGYDFVLDQGVGAIDRSAAARGGLYSGATGKALSEFGAGLANQEWNNYLSRLGGLAGSGQQAAGALSDLAYNTGAMSANTILGTAANKSNLRAGDVANVSAANTNLGLAQAAGITGSANAWNSGLTNLTSLIGYGAGQGFSMPGLSNINASKYPKLSNFAGRFD